MSRITGRTTGKCYIEFPSLSLAQQSIKQIKELRKRRIFIELSTQTELFNVLFPKYSIRKEISDIHDGIVFITKDETNILLSQCRSMRQKLRFNTRPFETIISILTKVHWDKPESISTLQRDHLFEMLKRNLVLKSGSRST
jgi:hypothetical protein